MVECESTKASQVAKDTSVLIDTWWNVNVSRSNLPRKKASVLIDTWWNVNEISAV